MGWSTPSISRGQVWFTTALEGGKSLKVICLDEQTGETIHDIEVFQHDDPGPIHDKNSYASPSVLIDGDLLYVHFGKLGTACLDRNAKIVWKTTLAYNHRHGPGGSPILFGDLLIIACDGTDVQYVTALNKHTGKEVWKTSRDGAMAYSTPLLIHVDGRPQIVSTGGEWAIAYEPLTGKEIWRFRYPKGYSNVPRPVYGHGLVFLCSGYDKPAFYAVKPNGSGDVTETHLVWKLERGAPLNPSPLIVGDEIYLVADNGIASCLDAKTEASSIGRVGSAAISLPRCCTPTHRSLSASTDEKLRKTIVIAPTKDEYKELAINELPGRTLATIAAANQSLFLRTDSAVYRIQTRK